MFRTENYNNQNFKTMDRFNSRWEKIHELKDRKIEITQLNNREKINRKENLSSKEMRNRANLRKNSKEILTENFPNLENKT